MMTPGFLAGAFRVNEENSLRALIPSGSNVGQAIIYFGALFLVGLGFFAWAILFHRQRRRRSSSGRSRNRTLAEAGGLPPVRTEKQPLSPA
jgi:hypothetical protein